MRLSARDASAGASMAARPEGQDVRKVQIHTSTPSAPESRLIWRSIRDIIMPLKSAGCTGRYTWPLLVAAVSAGALPASSTTHSALHAKRPCQSLALRAAQGAGPSARGPKPSCQSRFRI